MQPCQGALDDPPGPAQTAAVGCPALGELGRDAALPKLIAMGLRIGPAVALNEGKAKGVSMERIAVAIERREAALEHAQQAMAGQQGIGDDDLLMVECYWA